MEMINATLRTNYYKLDEHKQNKPWLSLKMKPSEIPEIPAPVPAFEIFVYAPDIEGCICAVVKSLVVGCVGQIAKKISVLKL